MVKLSAIQLCSVPNVDDNLVKISHFLFELINRFPINTEHLVLLPECCLYFGGADNEQLALAQNIKQTNLFERLAQLAKEYKVYLVAGTVPLLTEQGDKYTNTSYLFSPQGQLVADYHKIHLFDVVVDDNAKNYVESLVTQAGEKTTMASTSIGNIGLSVCYDLRFPELYRTLRAAGAEILTVPSAFTKVTGCAHWQALLQARAIENQCYVIAAGQQGKHANGRETWGHSMIISPWGEILSCLPEGEGIITANFERHELTRIRKAMPVHLHNQFTVELKN